MKSILVDALRQANGEEPDLKLDDSARLERSSVENASNDSETAGIDANVQDESESPRLPDDGSLELMQTTNGLVIADVVDGGNDDVQEADFDDAGLTSVAEVPAMASVAATPTSFEVAAFERWARWTPLVCAVLALVVAITFALFYGVSSSAVNPEALMQLRHDDLSGDAQLAETIDASAARFPYVETRSRGAPAVIVPEVDVPRVVRMNSPRQASNVTIAVRRASPVGSAPVDSNTFSTLDAAYRAYLAREITLSEINSILYDRVRLGNSETESAIKVLLHRHPDEAPLHYALGTMLAQSARWPEAQVAFAAAESLRSPGDGGSAR